MKNSIAPGSILFPLFLLLSAGVAVRSSTPPLVHLPFDSATGLETPDLMGRHHGLLVNGASIVPGGRSGNALRLNAAGKECVSLGDVLPMTNQSFSISGWIRVQNGDLTQAAAMFSRHNPGVGTATS